MRLNTKTNIKPLHLGLRAQGLDSPGGFLEFFHLETIRESAFIHVHLTFDDSSYRIYNLPEHLWNLCASHIALSRSLFLYNEQDNTRFQSIQL
jgi:hypothetical protein